MKAFALDAANSISVHAAFSNDASNYVKEYRIKLNANNTMS